MDKLKDSGDLREFSVEEALLLLLIHHLFAELDDGGSLPVSKSSGMFRFKEINNLSEIHIVLKDK